MNVEPHLANRPQQDQSASFYTAASNKFNDFMQFFGGLSMLPRAHGYNYECEKLLHDKLNSFAAIFKNFFQDFGIVYKLSLLNS